MISQDQVVSKCLSEAGQVFIKPSQLHYVDNSIAKNFFIPSVYEYGKYKPTVISEEITVYNDEWVIPKGVQKITSIRPSGQLAFSLFGYNAMGGDSMMLEPHWYDERNGKLLIASGSYLIKYLGSFTPTYITTDNHVYTKFKYEKNITVEVTEKVRPGSLRLSIHGGNDTYTISFDTSGKILSNQYGITGSFEFNKLLLELNFDGDMDIEGNILLSYDTINPCVNELSYKDTLFFNLFSSKFLKAYATTKSILRIEGLPYDLNTDDLMSYAREQDAIFREGLGDGGKDWWAFAY